MPGPNRFTADPRRRNLAFLLGASIVVALLAGLALYMQSSRTAPQNQSAEFFPGLAAKVAHGEAAKIRISSKKNGTFDVVFKPVKGGWVLPQKGDFPASFVTVNQTLVGLAAMQTIEPKTARADWLHYIGLDKGGDGVEIVVSGERDRELAHLIVGKSTDIGDPGGAVGLFVRKQGDAQSWLVRAPSEFQTDLNSWMQKTVIELDPGTIQSTVVGLANGTSYEVVRESRKDPHFKLTTPVPTGRAAGGPEQTDPIGGALAQFSFEDVKPLHEVDFTGAVHVTSRTFDGLSVTVQVAHVGAEYWAQVSAVNLSTKADIAKQARTINTRAAGWAYKLADYKGAQLTAPIESVLAPKPGQEPQQQQMQLPPGLGGQP